MQEEKYWIGFSCFPGVGPATFQLLLNVFGSAKDAWFATEKDLLDAGFGKLRTQAFLLFRQQFQPDHYLELLAKKHITFVTKHRGYPNLLASIPNPPFVLYVRGEFSLLMGENLVAVVGTRTMTHYGQTVTQMLTTDLVQAGITIVSGLAIGVDASAHKSCLEAGGKTIAVLASSVDSCTPRENQALYDRIIDEGSCIISEYPLGHIPNKGSFPARNRIIAGMSLGVLVTEGAQDSGSLITAQNALDYKRKVFAVPGPITSRVSRGPLSLVARGAHMVTSAADILSVLGKKNIPSHHVHTEFAGASENEKKIITVLQNEPLSCDEIMKRTGIDPSVIAGLLTLLEMKGILQSIDGGLFQYT